MTNDPSTATAKARAEIADFPMPQGLGGAPFDAAYAFQTAYVAAVGMPVGGYKLAVNGKPQMAHFGVDAPAAARIFAPEIYQSGVALPRAGFSAVSIEPEICAILGAGVANLNGPVDRDGALSLIDRFHPAFELIDQRNVQMPHVELAQAIALNVFNAGIVLGPDSIAPADLDLTSMTVTLDLNDVRVAEATGSAPQDPVEAVMWLLNHLQRLGQPVAAGMVVMCGTHLPLRTLDPAVSRVAISMSGLGEVSFSLEG